MRWQDIDFDRGFINIRDPKGGPDQKIPLNDSARKLLGSHERSESPFVFPGRNGGLRTVGPDPGTAPREHSGQPDQQARSQHCHLFHLPAADSERRNTRGGGDVLPTTAPPPGHQLMSRWLGLEASRPPAPAVLAHPLRRVPCARSRAPVSKHPRRSPL